MIIRMKEKVILFFAMEALEPKSVTFIVGLVCCFTLYQDCRYFETVKIDSIYLDSIDMGIMPGCFEMGKAEYLPTATETQNAEIVKTKNTLLYFVRKFFFCIGIVTI